MQSGLLVTGKNKQFAWIIPKANINKRAPLILFVNLEYLLLVLRVLIAKTLLKATILSPKKE